MAHEPVIYTDDEDASWTFTVTAADGEDVDWADPMVAVGSGDYEIAAEWLGDAGATRKLRVPLSGIERGMRTIYLQIPGGTDIVLGTVNFRDR